MSGTVNIARSLWDDEAFADAPFSEREAWIWMIADASWKARTRRIGDYIIDLERGQLAGSVRFWAKAWQWTPAKVQRFLARITKLGLVRISTDTGVSVVSICNYDDYQAKPKAADTRPIQDRYTSDTNEKKDEIREEGLGFVCDAPERDTAPSFPDFWSRWPLAKTGKAAAQKAFAKLSAKDREAATRSASAWAEAWRRANPRANDIHPSSYLNGRRWEDEQPVNVTPFPSNLGGNNGPRQDRETALSDALRDKLAFAGRARRTSAPDWL